MTALGMTALEKIRALNRDLAELLSDLPSSEFTVPDQDRFSQEVDTFMTMAGQLWEREGATS